MLGLTSYTENTKLVSAYIQEVGKAEPKPECTNVRDVRDCAVMELQHASCKLSGKTSIKYTHLLNIRQAIQQADGERGVAGLGLTAIWWHFQRTFHHRV